MYHKELFKTTNTGVLAASCLKGRIDIYAGPGEQDAPLWDEGERPLLLFPAEGATSLEELPLDERPIRLIVPDGTWRQAAKICNRRVGLAALPRVVLPLGPPSLYRLRHHPDGSNLSTMESIARAMSLLEGPETGHLLEDIFQRFQDRLLWLKGRLPADQVYGGLPQGLRP